MFRSGGFAKDLIYLKGFQSVVEQVAAGASLRPFWIGKIAPDHVGAIEELLHSDRKGDDPADRVGSRHV